MPASSKRRQRPVPVRAPVARPSISWGASVRFTSKSKLELVGDPAPPRHAVAIVPEHARTLDAAPPARPPLDVLEDLPGRFAGGLQEPSGQEGVGLRSRGSPSRA